ncbi:MAG: signal recognition particle protein [Candidatus Dadabacteria bacterium]|nr:MAG: signal recognition particle protein [Candidatus Dadabacteria bacterium]
MFDSLQDKLQNAFRSIRGKTKVSSRDIEETMKAVRMALLEADVNFKVAKDFCDRVAQKALGEEVLKSLTPDQQIIKIVYDELTDMMGAENAALNLSVAPPAIIMLVGLQGSGKTTTAGKLARLISSEYRKKPLLVPADVYRPAAIDQLKTIAHQLKLDAFDSSTEQDPVDIAREALDYASNHGYDVIILDTAGRLQIDRELMDELQEISDAVQPHEILLVADAMTGQEAVNVAQGFYDALEIDGLILTKLDGDARGGAALSMKAVTGCPIKFIGTGEKLDAIEVFYPDRMASRILQMGDVLTLVEKATKEIDIEESAKLHKKMRKNQFTLEDFLSQLKMIQRMGNITTLGGMIPGMGKLMKNVDPDQAEKELKKIEAIILSMTPQERRNQAIINGSRRKRIARGSGTSVQDVNRLLKQFVEMKKMMKKISKMGMGGLMNMFGGKGFPGVGR